MIDFHCHILPCVDDGSKSVEESINLLKMLTLQGVKTAIATPHFYANRETLDQFLGRRSVALEKLTAKAYPSMPKVICGAEVSYYHGISKWQELSKLCIENSRLLLLEMPMTRWKSYVANEVAELAKQGNITPVLAHIERYMSYQPREVFEKLLDSGVLMQINAEYLISVFTRRRALSMLKSGKIHFIGSDCHGLEFRKPRIGDAFKTVRKKLGDGFLSEINEIGCSLLNLK